MACSDVSIHQIGTFRISVLIAHFILDVLCPKPGALLVLLLCTEGYDQNFKVILYKGVVILLVPTVA